MELGPVVRSVAWTVLERHRLGGQQSQDADEFDGLWLAAD